ncbi:MAG: pyruvate formate lyase-activating protein [Candidatus Thorarchaeota archaeon]|nr:MAG: pyruvate formate lyase-activating protein [Candidatus Thorarchaeota archaeon]
MWQFLRPDSSRVWKDPETLRRLRRYRGIIDNHRWAKYLLCKDLECTLSLDASTHELWEHHALLSKRFAEYVRGIDLGKVRVSQNDLPETSFLDLKIEIAGRILQNCHFCERSCGVDRTSGKRGWCKLGKDSRVSSAFLHTGEEAPLVPSGTIFFASCCFACVFCQNQDISTDPECGNVVRPSELAALAESLHREGALNINYVGGDPIPNTHTIVSSMRHQTANVTQLWNSNLYCSEDTMRLLTHVIDVWLPDFKYGNDACAERLSGAKDYLRVVSRNHLLAYDSGEVIIRHLVLPNHIECCSIPILEWVSRNMPDCLVNIMQQYRPEHKVRTRPQDYPDISRRVSSEEMKRVLERADELGICWSPVS